MKILFKAFPLYCMFIFFGDTLQAQSCDVDITMIILNITQTDDEAIYTVQVTTDEPVHSIRIGGTEETIQNETTCVGLVSFPKYCGITYSGQISCFTRKNMNCGEQLLECHFIVAGKTSGCNGNGIGLGNP